MPITTGRKTVKRKKVKKYQRYEAKCKFTVFSKAGLSGFQRWAKRLMENSRFRLYGIPRAYDDNGEPLIGHPCEIKVTYTCHGAMMSDVRRVLVRGMTKMKMIGFCCSIDSLETTQTVVLEQPRG